MRNRIRRLSRMLEGYRPFNERLSIIITNIVDIIDWDDSKECFRTSFVRESSDGSVFSSIVERQFNVNVNGADFPAHLLYKVTYTFERSDMLPTIKVSVVPNKVSVIPNRRFFFSLSFFSRFESRIHSLSDSENEELKSFIFNYPDLLDTSSIEKKLNKGIWLRRVLNLLREL